MEKELNVSRIIKEDILRIIGERKERISAETVKGEIKASPPYISKAIEELEKEELIQSQQGFLSLTKRGQEIANNILEKHLVVENYFKRRKSEEQAHKIAHILEHYIPEEVVNNMKELSTFKEKEIPLTKFKSPKETLIVDITASNNKLFERIASMGVFPGEKIKITNEIPNGLIFKTKNKKFAFGKEVAKGIKVLE